MSYDDLRKGRFSEHGRIYFMTAVLEERQKCYFRNFVCARFAMAEMRVLHDSGAVNSLAWVIMPDHVHWLFQLGENFTLPSVVKRFKARSAHRVNGYLNRQGAL